MKQCYTVLLFASITLVQAQPSLTSADLLPAIGASFELNAGIYQEPFPGGADQTWDFSGLISGGTAIQNYIDPDLTLFGAQYTSATVAASANGQVRYFSNELATGLQEHGFASEPNDFNFPWSSPMLVVPPTVDHLDSWTDTYGGQTTFQGTTFERFGDVTGVADGWGTLIMPYGSFDNVMRIRLDIHFTDASIGAQGEFTETYYRYYAPGIPEPLVSTLYKIENLDQGATAFVGSSLIWLSDLNTAAPEPLAAVPFSLYPNPADHRCTIDVPSGVRVELFDAQGRLVADQYIIGGTTSIDVTGLPRGVYSVTVLCRTGGRLRNRLVVE